MTSETSVELSSAPGDGSVITQSSDTRQYVTFVAGDGRRAVLAFSSLDALHAWDADARPLPQAGREIAVSVLAGGLDALIIDIASARRVALQGEPLRLAAGSQALGEANTGPV